MPTFENRESLALIRQKLNDAIQYAESLALVPGPTGPSGPEGVPGPAGPEGPVGQGVPPTGTAGQILTKVDGTDYNTQWTSSVPTLSVSGDLTVADKIVHSDDTNTAIRFPAPDTVTFETNGSERLRIDNNGNLLIGTATSGVSKLRISGLPTSSVGLSAGDVWNDNGTLKIA